MATFNYPARGPITVDLVVTDAAGLDPSSLTLQLKLKLAVAGKPPTAAVASVATFNVAFVAASGAEPAYWRATIPAATSAAIAAGLYVTDGAIYNGATLISVTDPLLVQISESVTP